MTDSAAPRKRRILLIDDSTLSRSELEQAFAQRGYAVEEASDGAEGLRRLEEAPPDLVMIDIVMPTMDGLEVCRRIRARCPSETLPVIVMSSKEDRETMLHAFEVGADEFLQKPMDPEELFAAVEKLLADRGR